MKHKECSKNRLHEVYNYLFELQMLNAVLALILLKQKDFWRFIKSISNKGAEYFK